MAHGYPPGPPPMTITSYVLSAIFVVLCALSRRRRGDFFQAFELLSKVPGHLGVHVGEERFALEGGEPLRVVDGGRDLRRELDAERVVARLRDEAQPNEVLAEAIQRVLARPPFDLGPGAVAGGIVAGRVRTHAIGH